MHVCRCPRKTSYIPAYGVKTPNAKNPGAKLLNVKSEETLNTNPESEPQEPSVLILNPNRTLIAPAGARMQEIGWLGGTINILAQCRA